MLKAGPDSLLCSWVQSWLYNYLDLPPPTKRAHFQLTYTLGLHWHFWGLHENLTAQLLSDRKGSSYERDIKNSARVLWHSEKLPLCHTSVKTLLNAVWEEYLPDATQGWKHGIMLVFSEITFVFTVTRGVPGRLLASPSLLSASNKQ